MRFFLCKQKGFLKKSKGAFFMMVIFSLLLAGCFTGGKPQYNIESYILNYPAPSWNQHDKLAASVKFNRFSIAAAYNSTRMIFRNDAYSVDSFNYSHWAVNPADMVADKLLDDMTGSGLFQTVFSYQEPEGGRFIVSGGIEEFLLNINNNNKTAVISITITLQDSRKKETGKRIMFQKKYIRAEPLQDSSPRGYCQAASQAMQALSREIISDIYAAIKNASPSAADSP
ncbi:MAG: ABC-type transport auxiliary lipoprotein family protein [Smithellaceae bacterium]